MLGRAVIHLGVNVTSGAEMRSPGAEGRPFSGECYFEIIYYIASPPEHLVLVGDWGYWDGCTAGLIHPGKTSYFCMCFVKVIVNVLVVLLRAPTSLNLLLCWLKICYELPRLELVKRKSIFKRIHHFVSVLFYWSIKRMIPFCWLKRQLSGFRGTSVTNLCTRARYNQKEKAPFFPHSDWKRLSRSCSRKQRRVKT